MNVGQTGYAIGSHVNSEVNINGTRVDAMQYFKLLLQGAVVYAAPCYLIVKEKLKLEDSYSRYSDV